MQHFQPYDEVPQPTISEKERRFAMWATIGTGAAYALAQLLSAGNSRRNSKAWKKEVDRRQKMYTARRYK